MERREEGGKESDRVRALVERPQLCRQVAKLEMGICRMGEQRIRGLLSKYGPPISKSKLPRCMSMDKSQTFRSKREKQVDPLSFFTEKWILTHKGGPRRGSTVWAIQPLPWYLFTVESWLVDL